MDVTKPQDSQNLTATKEHCAVCFRTILAYLKGNPQPAYPASLAAGSCPLFVTWQVGKNEDLRGCIGTFSPSDVKSLLPKYAKISAFEDSRFDPIDLKEVPDLTVKVSFLTNFEYGLKAKDWIVGTHGIIIEFDDPVTGKL